MTIAVTRWRRLAAVAAVTTIASAAVLPASAAAPPSSAGADATRVLAGSSRTLTRAEIAAHDITDTPAGARALQRSAELGSGESARRSMRVLAFGDETWTVSAATPVEVRTGVDDAGEVAFEVVPTAVAGGLASQAGYAVPPSSAFRYSNEGYFDTASGTWYRENWWLVNKANDYKTSSTATPYDYYRITGKQRASSVTGASSNQGFKQTWIEFDRNNTNWTSPASYEAATPTESIAGPANTTKTVGYGTSFSVNLGAPPLVASGGTTSSYSGSMTSSTENWHPIIRGEIGSGGVMWCRYTTAEFTGTKYITARASVRTTATAAGGSFGILTGQRDTTSYCPSQI